MTDGKPASRAFDGVMISSTFADLKVHRAKLMTALAANGLYSVAMEHDAALPSDTLIDSSLRKVHEAAAYIVIVGHCYGKVPVSERNPDELSLTELEFREARQLGWPILVFLMGDEHPVTINDVERDPAKVEKLGRFRDAVKNAGPTAGEERVYSEFNSVSEFAVAAMQSVAGLRSYLDHLRRPPAAGISEPPPTRDAGIPDPPAMYAEPPYIGSHAFVGRDAELQRLDDWAAPSDPHPVLFLEAIGGTGKSMLTWHWVNAHAGRIRPDRAGTFWYSFYEHGSLMSDFCRRALAYMTGVPMETVGRRTQRDLGPRLLRELSARPWLLVLDGLERVLVAYHRFDAAQLVDERAGQSDEVGGRDPRDAIRPEDDDFLRQLAGAAPSKILVTSRLVPRTLLNQSGLPIPGVSHRRLLGLRPPDAEKLLRSCAVSGDSRRMQSYLQRHCDCHPLVVGILGGLVSDYYAARGDFDRWSTDPRAGGHFDLGELDIVQKRHHILTAALDALDENSRELLGTLALLPEAADNATVEALIPRDGTDEDQWKTVRDLERRGLLQYDHGTQHYDLHPVVRAVAAARLGGDDATRLGQRVVDYFSQQQQTFEHVESIEDVRRGLTVVRTYLQMGRLGDAYRAYLGPLSNALHAQLEASGEILTLLRPFFGQDWTQPARGVSDGLFGALATHASVAFSRLGMHEKSLTLDLAVLQQDLVDQEWLHLRTDMANLAMGYGALNQIARQAAWVNRALRLAVLLGSADHVFVAQLHELELLTTFGRYTEAQALWRVIDAQRRPQNFHVYRIGDAEIAHARLLLYQGDLTADRLATVEEMLAGNRPKRRALQVIRGRWEVSREHWDGAAESYGQAVRMAREVGLTAGKSECWLALAQFRLGRLRDALPEATRLSAGRSPQHLALALLWAGIGDDRAAAEHATAAYRQAWSDGEPYVRRYQLREAKIVLEVLGAEVPALTNFDPAVDPADPLEARIDAAITAMRSQVPGL